MITLTCVEHTESEENQKKKETTHERIMGL
jgi:hypothetical protein